MFCNPTDDAAKVGNHLSRQRYNSSPTGKHHQTPQKVVQPKATTNHLPAGSGVHTDRRFVKLLVQRGRTQFRCAGGDAIPRLEAGALRLIRCPRAVGPDPALPCREIPSDDIGVNDVIKN